MNQIQVAVPVPMRQIFSYLHTEPVSPGIRVMVPFGRRTLVGVVVQGQSVEKTAQKSIKLKQIKKILDLQPVISASMLTLLEWSAQYYHHPLGEVIYSALPTYLRQANPATAPDKQLMLRRTKGVNDDEIIQKLKRAPKQQALYDRIPQDSFISPEQIRHQTKAFARSNLTSLANTLIDKGLITGTWQTQIQPDIEKTPFTGILNPEQHSAISRISHSLSNYACFVLHGITGSGKTEVYLHIAETCLNQNKQVLVLVPEISLTPQLIDRFKQRLGKGLFTMHSSMTQAKRYLSWWNAKAGKAKVILGTRSAIFSPLVNPGLIIVDEEHDLSFKQSDGFRYHARDLAIKRANLESIPIVLGSATPSMESMNNVKSGKHYLLKLHERTNTAKLPKITLIDLKRHPHQDGLSPQLLELIKQQLANNKQTILYINRRGFAPIAQCRSCGWQANCDRCDAFMTVHYKAAELRCHHCGSCNRRISNCPDCKQSLFYAGIGTQRVEQALKARFPEASVYRFDRDEITTYRKLEAALQMINENRVDIIIGTQLIAKGHDFPGVTLVGVINPDQGLYSSDFRATEYLVQQITQVAGRAGRSTDSGEVMIQTAHPDHPYLQFIQNHSYDHFYQLCSKERQLAQLPPFGYLALWRAESTDSKAALNFLATVKTMGLQILQQNPANTIIMDPVSSPMEKLAGRYRAQLLIKSSHRTTLHNLIKPWLDEVSTSKQSRKVRWSMDIDPMEMY